MLSAVAYLRSICSDGNITDRSTSSGVSDIARFLFIVRIDQIVVVTGDWFAGVLRGRHPVAPRGCRPLKPPARAGGVIPFVLPDAVDKQSHPSSFHD